MAGVSTKEIKNRIRSMESTRQITKAMEMVAASKLRHAQARVLNSRPYFEILYETITDIVSQYNMLSGFSEKLQLMLLESSIESYNNEVDIKMQLDGMMQVWAKGDEEKLSQMVAEDLTDEELTEEESKLLEEYNTKMITNRNHNMTEWAKNALKNGKKVFICVGAAHIVGEGAIADELEKAGYTVEIIK